ncbi:MAG: hypothetical protein WCH99_19435 [Verrucomicrobiota bacterium]
MNQSRITETHGATCRPVLLPTGKNIKAMNENSNIRSDRNCAYCGEAKGKLTREHIFPDALDIEYRKDGKGTKDPYWIERLEKKFVIGQPTIKDVCANCNNIVLSQLDTYGLSLYKKYFCKIAEKGQRIDFEFDYDLLLRWILKLSYNSARVNNAGDLEQLRKYRSFILGRHKRPSRLALYLTLIYRHETDEPTKAFAAKLQKQIPHEHTPDLLRIGHFKIQSPGWSALVSRTVFFQSFLFSIFSVGEKQPYTEFDKLQSQSSHRKHMKTSGNKGFLATLNPMGRSVPVKTPVNFTITNKINSFAHISYGTALNYNLCLQRRSKARLSFCPQMAKFKQVLVCRHTIRSRLISGRTCLPTRGDI